MSLCFARYPYLSLPLSLAVPGACALYLYLRLVTIPGILHPSRHKCVGGTTHVPVPAHVIGTLDINGHYGYKRSSSRSHPLSRLKASPRVIAIRVRVLQLQYCQQSSARSSGAPQRRCNAKLRLDSSGDRYLGTNWLFAFLHRVLLQGSTLLKQGFKA
jgi:hypothetical protein